MTGEKVQRSIDGTSISKGRRKMIMLDEAAVSKKSLNFGPATAGSALVNASIGAGTDIPFINAGSIVVGGNSSESITPLRPDKSSSEFDGTVAGAGL